MKSVFCRAAILLKVLVLFHPQLNYQIYIVNILKFMPTLYLIMIMAIKLIGISDQDGGESSKEKSRDPNSSSDIPVKV